MFKALREKRGLTQEELAGKVGVTKAYISQLESGARKNPSLVVLKRLAKALRVPITALLK
jgi:transcriptional regulator with XRE-family HTH domain